MRFLRKIRNFLTRLFKRQPTYPFRVLFGRFQSILTKNSQALELIADMGDKLGGDYVFDRQYIVSITGQLSELVRELIYDLNVLAPQKYLALLQAFERTDYQLQQELAGKWVLPEGQAVIPYRSWNQNLNEEVGNKNAGLAEIRNVLELPTPEGFAITTSALRLFMERNGLYEPVEKLLRAWDEAGGSATDEVAQAIQKLIGEAKIPPEISDQVNDTVEQLETKSVRGQLRFAVRSSAWGEDSEHSFAGQYQSFLNVPQHRLLHYYQAVIASAFSSSVMEYRRQKGFQIQEIAMAVGCQVMVKTKASGVLYTLDPAAPEQETMLVSAAWGLGTPLVEGKVQADQYVLSRAVPHALQSVHIVRKPTMLVAGVEEGTAVREVAEELQSRSCLNSEQLNRLAEMALLIERYFKRPQDIEWALDENDNLVIVQSRQLNIQSPNKTFGSDISEVVAKYPVLLEGQGVVVQRGVATGKVFRLEDESDLAGFPPGCILVARHTSPRLAKIVRRVHGILTDVGSPTGHMATIAREFRVPTIVNTKIATEIFQTGDEITLDATQNVVYAGKVNELCYFEFTEEAVFEETYEYRLLRRILRRISPLNLLDPHARNFTPGGCKTYHDIIRFVHEKAVEELIHLEYSRRRGGEQAARRLKFDIPLGLIVIDIGGGIGDTRESTAVVPGEIRSVPMQAFLEGLLEPGMWNTEPVSVDFGSFMSSMTRTFSSSLASPNYVGQNLAVVSGEYLDLSLRLGYHFNIIDAYVAENPNDNYAYFRFLGGVTDAARRSRRARFIAKVLERFHFRVEVRGDLVVGRIKKLEREKMQNKVWVLGCLVSYTRQLDTLMHSDEYLDQYLEDFIGRIMKSKRETAILMRRPYERRSQDSGFDLG